MNKTLLIRHSLVVAATFCLSLAQAETMAKADYRSAKSVIGAAYKADLSACSSYTANAKDICVEEAKAKDKVARAELEFAYSGSARNETRVHVAKAESGYAVAKEKCDDMSGQGKEVCVKEAKAVETQALAEAKVGKKVNAAITDAAKDMIDAKYKLAAEKCEAMAVDMKAACMVAAKAEAGRP
jgi:hypothetical protein